MSSTRRRPGQLPSAVVRALARALPLGPLAVRRRAWLGERDQDEDGRIVHLELENLGSSDVVVDVESLMTVYAYDASGARDFSYEEKPQLTGPPLPHTLPAHTGRAQWAALSSEAMPPDFRGGSAFVVRLADWRTRVGVSAGPPGGGPSRDS